jgi:hypothetical protein
MTTDTRSAFEQDAYTQRLATLINSALVAEPQRFADARAFADLHDVCDANEFLLEADTYFADVPDSSNTDFAHYNAALEVIDTLVAWPEDDDEDEEVEA